ncbi:hypothetical protein M758_8G095300 [Ceratodon purpureus]|nr:hypothetical protein M758_8G095300 [Ceratodon purpureus]
MKILVQVQTSDGFLLGLQHIPYGVAGITNDTQKRPPVFLQHGLTQGGDDWVLNSPSQSLAYILADRGFDVWIGNLRGTRFSHGHTTLSPDDWRFWDWSFNEHASIDMPTMVGYVQRSTASQVYYVGHSQGTIMALAAMSDPDTGMSNLLKASALLAPIAYMQHMKSQLLSVSVDLMLDKIVGIFGTREFNLNNEVGEKLLGLACAEPNVFCDNLFRAYTGPNCCFNDSRALYYLQWEPQSTSTKNLQHLAQMIRSGKFERFDYGWLGNIIHYKQGTPPLYDLSRIPSATNILMVSGGQDGLADPSDVKKLQDEMTCQVESLILPSYGHADFVVGTQAHVDVYNRVIQYFQSLP